MITFKSWRSYRDFERAVKKETRYLFDCDIKNFLDTLLETAKSKIEKIKAGAIFWRSQLGHDWDPHDDGPGPYPAQRMKPVKNSATDGRANPKGISYLYLSTDKNTAMAEVRPWIGSYISLAEFKLLKDVIIINCSTHRKWPVFYSEEPSPTKRKMAIWQDIDEAFSRPVTTNEDSTDYVPTQIIAELFKNNGFDGIAYRSSLGKGHNIALFNLEAADLCNCTLFLVKEISFNFSQASNTYFIPKYYKK